MTLVINTLDTNDSMEDINALLPKGQDVETVNTSSMKIAHCMGCNQCWLKTPGVCAIKDDYEVILKKIIKAHDLWLVADTRFGFISHNGKRILDRIMPVLNMYIVFRNGDMRHQLRYHEFNVGLIYKGDGDQQMLDEWCERTAANLGGKSLGAYRIKKGKEAASCM